jgi:acetyl esterase
LRLALRQKLGPPTNRTLHRLADRLAHGLSRVSHVQHVILAKQNGIRIARNLRYAPGAGRAHLLDVYTPPGAGPHPVIFYVHGGGFAMLSKDTHRFIALAFARRGYVVININYRLGYALPFPLPLQDAAHALAWARDNAARFGGDISQLVLAGESAGGNLVTALALACREPPDFLPRLGVTPRAVMPFYPMLEVANLERLQAKRPLPSHIWSQILHAGESYLGKDFRTRQEAWANPLNLIEALPAGASLPPFFTICGTKDPLLPDAKRLYAALARLHVPCELVIAPGEIHAYNVLIWRPAAREAWQRTFAFLDRVISK